MQGLMQDWPLLVHTILDHARNWHGDQEIVSRTVEGPIHRCTYTDLDRRARQIGSAAQNELKIGKGDVIATMAWNGYRHMEIWYGLMSIGAVVHTLNPRLFTDQLTYIVNHAEDQWVFLDLTFVPILEGVKDQLPKVKGYVIMTDKAHMPAETSLPNVVCYEDLIDKGDAGFQWPKLDENTACGMCYTSGTTGNPKGVMYSHRSNVLHAMVSGGGDALPLSSRETIMPVVPMFHANAWSMVFSAPMAGAKMVMPGAQMDGASIYELLDSEEVSLTLAVPTIWLMLLQYLEKNPDLKLAALKNVVIGGAACPEAMMRAFEDNYDTNVIHAWGMTEMSPLGSLGTRKGGLDDMDADTWWQIKLKQGRPAYSIEMKITDDDGNELAQDGVQFGRLKVRGPSIAKSYFKGEGADVFDDEGWFDTGDVATIDEHGYMQITDRSKDVIKSGGEWISSIDLENIAMGCPGVAEAAAIGMPHHKWDERPMLVIVPKPDEEVTKDQVLAHLDGKIVKWWTPDDVVFTDEIPH
ncbi:MAG: long-chain-fatty-acid--CoA ligase, partial [Rhizobiales bacterium]|nr:long-chain-fatty-acid--CoA ligase [Hyphomicrobiales bacterium]